MALSIVDVARTLSTICWIVWLPTSAVVLWRTSRCAAAQLMPAHRLVLFLVPMVVLLLAMGVPFSTSIDPYYMRNWDDPWRGLAGRTLIDLVTPYADSPERVAVWIARSIYLATPLAALAVLGLSHKRDASIKPASGQGHRIFVFSLLLVGNPIMLRGSIDALYIFFVPTAIAVVLVAGRDCLAARSTASIGALLTSLILLGWSRPEITPVFILVTMMLAWQAWRRRQVVPWALTVGLVIVGLALSVSLPEEMHFLVNEARIDRISLGNNVLGEQPAWRLLPLLTENVLRNLPRILVKQTVFTAGLFLLAIAHLAGLVRRRVVGSFDQWLSVTILVAYVLTCSPHRDGLGASGLAKYGLVISLPVWHLAMSYLADPGRRSSSRTWIVIAGAISAGYFLVYLGTSLRHRQVIQAREQFYWTTAPRFGRDTCHAGDGQPVCVAVGAVGQESRQAGRFETLDQQRIAAVLMLRKAGCLIPEVHAQDRDDISHPADVLSELLCSELATCMAPANVRLPADHALVVQLGPEGGAQVRRFLDGSDNCGWQRTSSYPDSTILERRREENGARQDASGEKP